MSDVSEFNFEYFHVEGWKEKSMFIGEAEERESKSQQVQTKHGRL